MPKCSTCQKDIPSGIRCNACAQNPFLLSKTELKAQEDLHRDQKHKFKLYAKKFLKDEFDDTFGVFEREISENITIHLNTRINHCKILKELLDNAMVKCPGTVISVKMLEESFNPGNLQACFRQNRLYFQEEDAYMQLRYYLKRESFNAAKEEEIRKKAFEKIQSEASNVWNLFEYRYNRTETKDDSQGAALLVAGLKNPFKEAQRSGTFSIEKLKALVFPLQGLIDAAQIYIERIHSSKAQQHHFESLIKDRENLQTELKHGLRNKGKHLLLTWGYSPGDLEDSKSFEIMDYLINGKYVVHAFRKCLEDYLLILKKAENILALPGIQQKIAIEEDEIGLGEKYAQFLEKEGASMDLGHCKFPKLTDVFHNYLRKINYPGGGVSDVYIQAMIKKVDEDIQESSWIIEKLKFIKSVKSNELLIEQYGDIVQEITEDEGIFEGLSKAMKDSMKDLFRNSNIMASLAKKFDPKAEGLIAFLMRYRVLRINYGEAQAYIEQLRGKLLLEKNKVDFVAAIKAAQLKLVKGQDPEDPKPDLPEALKDGLAHFCACLNAFIDKDLESVQSLAPKAFVLEKELIIDKKISAHFTFLGEGATLIKTLYHCIEGFDQRLKAYGSGVGMMGKMGKALQDHPEWGISAGGDVMNIVAFFGDFKALATLGGGITGAGGILTGVHDMATKAIEYNKMESILDRYKRVMATEDLGKSVIEALDSSDYLRFSWHKILEKIGRRQIRDVLGGVGAGLTTTGGGLGIAIAAGASAAAIPVAGWAVAGVSLAIGLGMLTYKFARSRYKRDRLEKLKEKIRTDPKYSRWTVPEFCKTTGDFYRYTVASYIYKEVVISGKKGTLLAYILIGGSPGGAVSDALHMDISGLMAYMKD